MSFFFLIDSFVVSVFSCVLVCSKLFLFYKYFVLEFFVSTTNQGKNILIHREIQIGYKTALSIKDFNTKGVP